MKTLIFLFFLLPVTAFSQRTKPKSSDTIHNILTNLDQAGINLSKFHLQYRSGVQVSVGSLAIAGVLFGLGSQDPVNGKPYYQAASVFSAISLVGVIMMIDSHKFVKRSSIYLRNAGSQVSLGLTF